MAASILLAFWRKPLPFVPEDVRRAGAFQIARLAVGFIVVVLVFAGSSYLAQNWIWVAFGAVILASVSFLLTFWLCMSTVYTYRPHPRAKPKRIVGGKLTKEATEIRTERKKSIVDLLEESGDQPDRVFERSSVAGNQALIILCVLTTMVGGRRCPRNPRDCISGSQSKGVIERGFAGSWLNPEPRARVRF